MITEIKTVLGESRPITRRYPDGSFECPWCFAAVLTPRTECSNPACDSSKYWAPERLQEWRDRQAARAEAEARRKRDHELAMERIVAEKAAIEAWQKEQVAKAVKGGYCLLCLFAPGWMRTKFVRHRKACPKMVRSHLRDQRERA